MGFISCKNKIYDHKSTKAGRGNENIVLAVSFFYCIEDSMISLAIDIDRLTMYSSKSQSNH